MASDSETSLGLRDDISQILRVSDQPLEQLEATAQALLSHSDGTFKDLAELCPCLHQSSSLPCRLCGVGRIGCRVGRHAAHCHAGSIH